MAQQNDSQGLTRKDSQGLTRKDSPCDIRTVLAN